MSAQAKAPALADFRRIVVKVGSSLLVDAAAGKLKEAWLASLAADIAKLHKEKRDVLVVSSGAIALGRAVLKLPKGTLKLEDSQAAAAVGQIALARTWTEVLGKHGIIAGQVLVTLGDTEERTRYLNARSTIGKLLEWRSVPIINENDTVATTEIRYGDNDRLAARVATMASADLLVLLSDVDGLYDAPPARNAKAKFIALVPRITKDIEAMAGDAASDHARGGMRTKIEAGKIATTAGTHMVIASGHVENPLAAIAAGGRATWFLTPANPVTARKKWIAGSLEPKGTLTIDAGAVAALRRGQKPPARGRGPRRRRVRPRRRCRHSRPRRRRGRARAGRLRRRRRRQDHPQVVERYHAHPRHRGRFRDGASRRSGDGRGVTCPRDQSALPA